MDDGHLGPDRAEHARDAKQGGDDAQQRDERDKSPTRKPYWPGQTAGPLQGFRRQPTGVPHVQHGDAPVGGGPPAQMPDQTPGIGHRDLNRFAGSPGAVELAGKVHGRAIEYRHLHADHGRHATAHRRLGDALEQLAGRGRLAGIEHDQIERRLVEHLGQGFGRHGIRLAVAFEEKHAALGRGLPMPDKVDHVKAFIGHVGLGEALLQRCARGAVQGRGNFKAAPAEHPAYEIWQRAWLLEVAPKQAQAVTQAKPLAQPVDDLFRFLPGVQGRGAWRRGCDDQDAQRAFAGWLVGKGDVGVAADQGGRAGAGQEAVLALHVVDQLPGQVGQGLRQRQIQDDAQPIAGRDPLAGFPEHLQDGRGEQRVEKALAQVPGIVLVVVGLTQPGAGLLALRHIQQGQVSRNVASALDALELGCDRIPLPSLLANADDERVVCRQSPPP